MSDTTATTGFYALNLATPAILAQYNADLQVISAGYEAATITTVNYQVYTNGIYAAMDTSDYMTNRVAVMDSIVYLPVTTSADGVYPAYAENIVVAPTVLSANNSTGLASAAAVDTSVTTSTLADYGSGSARLTNIASPTCERDDARLGYLKLIDSGTMAAVASGAQATILKDIYNSLTAKSGYNKFIITALHENRSERSMIMNTVGDSFAATFSGREPMVINVQGLLIFDYAASGVQSWYLAFLNAYERYLRASQLAKYKAKVTLVLPEFTEYVGYIISISTSQSADNDLAIPMNFSMLVCNDTFNKAATTGGATIASTTTTTSASTASTSTTTTGSVAGSTGDSAIQAASVGTAGTVGTSTNSAASSTTATDTTVTKSPATVASDAQAAAKAKAAASTTTGTSVLSTTNNLIKTYSSINNLTKSLNLLGNRK